MKTTFLEFEQPIAELEQRIEELRYVADDSAVDISEEIQRLTKRSQTLTKDIYGQAVALAGGGRWRAMRSGLTRWTMCRLLFTHFESCTATALSPTTPSIVGGLARFGNAPCVVNRPPEGRDTKEKICAISACPSPGLPQGAAPDEARREVLAAGVHLRRHARAYPGSTRGARAVGSHRPQSVRDGAAAHPGHRQRDRRGRLGGALAIAWATRC